MRSHIFLSLMLCGVMASCANLPEQKRSERHEVVDTLIAAFNARDMDTLVALHTNDAVIISPDYCEPFRGHAGVRQHYGALFQEIPDVQDTLENIVVAGDKIAIEFVASGTYQGHSFELPIAGFLTMKDGLIDRDVAYFDADPSPDCA